MDTDVEEIKYENIQNFPSFRTQQKSMLLINTNTEITLKVRIIL